jgi:hypothetical protein
VREAAVGIVGACICVAGVASSSEYPSRNEGTKTMTQSRVRSTSTELESVLEADFANTVACPECGHLAVVEWRSHVGSTDGSIEHLKIRCLNRHWLLMPAESLSG